MTETQDKRLLDMRQIMGGLENLFDPDTSTIFDVTMKTNAGTCGHREWLKQELPEWARLLNHKSGARVIVIELDKEEKRPNIVAKLVIDGRIKYELITNSRLKTAIPSQIKKELALLILEHLPPPFDVREPLFKAGVPDTFLLRPTNSRRIWYESEIEILKSDDIKKELDEIAGGRRATILKVSKPKGTRSESGTITLRWFNNASNSERLYLAKAMGEHLKETKCISFDIFLEEMLG